MNELLGMFNSEKIFKATIRFSYIEVYNEVLRDLLVTDDKNIDIREDPERGVVVSGVSEILTSSKKEILTMIKIGNKNRTKEATASNEASSRSHAVVLMSVEVIENSPEGVGEKNLSKFFVVDLAGSEKASLNKGQRYVEGANINKSLLALGNCINALAELGDRGKGGYIPFRDSKLTRLLKDSLGGNSRTMMIATISPCGSDYEDSLNTLKYASRAKRIKTKTEKNIVQNGNTVADYTKILEMLKKENSELKKTLVEADKTPPIEKNPDVSNQQQNLVKLFEEQVNQHFIDEREQRKKIIAVEESIFNIETQAKKERKTDDQQIIRLQNLTKQREDLIYSLQGFLAKRKTLNDDIQNSGLSNVQNGFLMNLFYKKQMEMDLLSGKSNEKKREKTIDYKDWVIQFLKDQVEMRDKVMVEQINVLDTNEIIPKFSYDGLKKVTDLPEDLQSGSEFTLPPLFPNRMKKGVNSSQPVLHNPYAKLPKMKPENQYGNPKRYVRPSKQTGYTKDPMPSSRRSYNKNLFSKYREKSVNKYYKGAPPRVNSNHTRSVNYLLANGRNSSAKQSASSSRGYKFQARSKQPSAHNRSLNLSEKSYSTSSSSYKNRVGVGLAQGPAPKPRSKPYFGVQRKFNYNYKQSPYVAKYARADQETDAQRIERMKKQQGH